MNQAAPPAIPFSVASRVNQRLAFEFTATLGAAAVTPAGIPFQLPAVGFPKSIRMEFTLTNSGGTPSYTADAPFNVIQNISLKNSAGQTLIPAINGYSLYAINKYGSVNTGIASGVGAGCDPRFGRQYSAVAATGAHFFLDIPFEIDPSNGFGAIPALASNRSYLLEITFAPIATVFGTVTPPTSASVVVNASVVYWDAPMPQTPRGASQGTEPFGMSLDNDFTTTVFWLSEFPSINTGQQLPRSNNVGNAIRTLIFILRDNTGARSSTIWPAEFFLYVNQYPQLRFKRTEWEDAMARWFGLGAAAYDAVGGLDTGVYVIPFSLLAGGITSDPSNSRAQILGTEDGTLLQYQMNNVGAGVGSFQILTQAVAAPNPLVIYSK